MLNSKPVRTLWHSFNWLSRLAIVAVMFIGVAIIVLRYLVLPDIESYHEQITKSLGGAIGIPVTIGKIESDWQGFYPRLNLRDVRILDAQHKPVLVLPRIDSSVSWLSLFAAELRFASLEIDKPELLIRRDAQGMIFIGGMATSQQGGDYKMSDWLMRQSSIAVHDALVVWEDEQRDGVPLVLQKVNLHLENWSGHHRFALRAVPPEKLATPLDVRGDLHGESFNDVEKWRGQIFSQFDFTDATAWRHWLDLPKEFSSGRGAVRGWMNVEGGMLTGATADVALYNTVAKLADDAPEIQLANLRGRVTLNELAGGFEVSLQDLALRLHNGVELEPTDLYFRMAKAINGQPPSAEIRANQLQLDKIASLASYLPLEAEFRARLDAMAPRGIVSDLAVQWQGGYEKPASFKIKAQIDNLALHQVGLMPGFSGLSLDVDGSDAGGKLNINTRQLVVDAPGVMREPLNFDVLIGQVNWMRKGDELVFNVGNVLVANNDLAGVLTGSYQTQANAPGVIDLTETLTRGDIRRAARYTPLIALNKEGGEWLNGALLAGHTEDLSIHIKGDLSGGAKKGDPNALHLEIGGHAHDAVLEFDKRWPRIENITGELSIRDNRLEVKASSATMLDAQLHNVTVTMPELNSDDLPLVIKGEAVAASDQFLDFVQKSPVRGYLSGTTDGIRARGNAHLDLFAHIPLRGDKPVLVSGKLDLQRNDIDFGEGVPLLRNTSGELTFTESGMQASGISAEILGGTASINAQTVEGGVIHVTVQGRSNLDALRKIDSAPLLNYLHGGAAWDADISAGKKSAKVVVNSDLKGISSSLPRPFAKRASETLPLHIEKMNVAGGRGSIVAHLDNLFAARLESASANLGGAVTSGTISFGKQQLKNIKLPRGKNGVWLVGKLPELSVQGWGDLVGESDKSEKSGKTGKSGQILPISGIRLSIGKLTGFGQEFNALGINAAKRGKGLLAKLSGKTLSGDVEWQPNGFNNRSSKFSVHLKKLQWRLAGKQAGSTNADSNDGSTKPGDLAALDIAIENLQINNKPVGRFELAGNPDGRDWQLRSLNITNPDGSLSGNGVLHRNAISTQSQIKLLLNISNAGKILDNSGYPNTVEGGSGKLSADLSWIGMPDDFSYATLNGSLKLETGNGRFRKMNPGAGKLLSILSMQALPKHVTLDFTDVFSEGFQFDSIEGNAAIINGVMYTQNLNISGSSAKVTMQGSVDLDHETQNLRVKVSPTIGDSVSLIGAFAISPAVGIGSLIVNKILGDPLDKLVSFEYNVGGTWSDPSVVKIGGTTAKEKGFKPTENKFLSE